MRDRYRFFKVWQMGPVARHEFLSLKLKKLVHLRHVYGTCRELRLSNGLIEVSNSMHGWEGLSG